MIRRLTARHVRPDRLGDLFSTAISTNSRPSGSDFALGAAGCACSAVYSWTEPDLDLPGLEVESETLFATPDCPTRSCVPAACRMLSGGYDHVDQDLTVNDLRLARDRARRSRRNAGRRPRQRRGCERFQCLCAATRRTGRIELRRIDLFDATPDCARPLNCIVAGVAPNRTRRTDPFLLRVDGRPIIAAAIAVSRSGCAVHTATLPAFGCSAGNYRSGAATIPAACWATAVTRWVWWAMATADGHAPGAGASLQRHGLSGTRTRADRASIPTSGRPALACGWPMKRAAGRHDARGPLERPDLVDRGDVRFVSLTTRLLPWRF